MLNLWTWWHNEASPTLPGYILVFLLSLACSRRVPALRPVAACFAAWSLLDAVTGPLWLRAGVLVAWPGAALVAGAWGLVVAEHEVATGPARERRGKVAENQTVENASPLGHVVRRLVLRPRQRGRVGDEGIDGGRAWLDAHASNDSASARSKLALAIAAVYLLAGCLAALPYALGFHGPYHLALMLSRRLAVVLCLVAPLLRPLPRTWAARACVAPAVGLACGVVAGVWTLLPAGMGAVREAWGRLAGAETAVTLGVTAGCVVGAWWEARRTGRAR